MIKQPKHLLTNGKPITNRQTKFFNKTLIKQKIDDFLNAFIVLLSIWLTVVMIVIFFDHFTALGSVFYKILLSLFLWVLIYLTLNVLKYIISTGIIIGIVILLLFFYHKYYNPKSLDKEHFVQYINISNCSCNQIQYTIDSMSLELEIKKNQIDSLKKCILNVHNKIDSLDVIINQDNTIKKEN